MTDQERVINLLQKCLDDWPYAATRVPTIMKRIKAAVEILKAYEPCEDAVSRKKAIQHMRKWYFNKELQSAKDDPCVIDAMNDMKFLVHIITEICDYAIENDMEPDATLDTIADNIKAARQISTFNKWKKDSGTDE